MIKPKKTNKLLAVTLVTYMTTQEVNMDKIGNALGVTPDTLYRRRRNPGMTRISELRRIADLANLTNDEIAAIVRDSE